MSKITAAMVKELRETTGSAMMDCKKALVECDGDMDSAKENLRKKGQVIAQKKSAREANEGAISIFAKDANQSVTLVKIACETDFVAINDKFKTFIAQIARIASEVGMDDFMEQTSEEGSVKEIFTSSITELGENIVYLEGQKWESEKGYIGNYTHSNGKIGVLVELIPENSDALGKLPALAKDLAMHIAASQVQAIRVEDLDPAVVEKEKAFLIDQAKDSGKPMEIIEKMVQGRMKKFKKEICLLDQAFVKDPTQSVTDLLKATEKEIGCSLTVSRFYKANF